MWSLYCTSELLVELLHHQRDKDDQQHQNHDALKNPCGIKDA